MNELEVSLINNTINYQDGKIYYDEGSDYTSKLWKKLSKNGWRMVSNKGIKKIYDNNGNIAVVEIGRVRALKSLSDLMR